MELECSLSWITVAEQKFFLLATGMSKTALLASGTLIFNKKEPYTECQYFHMHISLTTIYHHLTRK